MNRKHFSILFLVALVFLIQGIQVTAQGPTPRAPRAALGTGFTYQGQLKSGGSAYTGACDFQFGVWDDASIGAQKGVTQTVTSVSVTNGLFTTTLNGGNEFGAMAFDGNARWLAIAVRCPAGSGSYTALNPRQELTAAPYALTAMKTAYKNVLVVAKQGGHYNTISAALTSITDNSTSNRYLIWVAPGTYTETVTMKQYVDIEGAGELTTKITQVGNSLAFAGTVVGANNAELRFLTVENTGGNSYAVAIYNGTGSPRLTQITATASSGGIETVGVSNFSTSPTMTNVTATASGGTTNAGVINSTSSSPKMQNVTATASGGTSSYGVYNYNSSSPTMTNVTATALGGTNSFGVSNNSSSSPTMTDVTATGSGGTNSYGVYNTSASPTMINVTATSSGGLSNAGVANYSSSPTMTNVTATGSGGTFHFGVYNFSSSSPTMTNVTVRASGGTSNYGVYNTSSSPTIQNSSISASGGISNNYGIYNNATSGLHTVTVNNSQITGSTNTIFNDTEFTTRIGASKLDGGAVNVNGGTVTCIGAYDENYTSPGYTTCP
jgi:hypothetical protein